MPPLENSSFVSPEKTFPPVLGIRLISTPDNWCSADPPTHLYGDFLRLVFAVVETLALAGLCHPIDDDTVNQDS